VDLTALVLTPNESLLVCHEFRREVCYIHLVGTDELMPGTGLAQNWCFVGYNIIHCSCDELAKGASEKMQCLKRSWAENQTAKEKQVFHSRH
jgi:hypothetical protein